MKLVIDKNLAEFTPDTEEETKQLNELWNLIVDCAKFNKKLVPIGEFVPGKTNTARFAIED